MLSPEQRSYFETFGFLQVKQVVQVMQVMQVIEI